MCLRLGGEIQGMNVREANEWLVPLRRSLCLEPKGLSHGTISMLQSTIAGPRAPADAFSQKTPKASGDQPFAVHANGTYASARPPGPLFFPFDGSNRCKPPKGGLHKFDDMLRVMLSMASALNRLTQ